MSIFNAHFLFRLVIKMNPDAVFLGQINNVIYEDRWHIEPNALCPHCQNTKMRITNVTNIAECRIKKSTKCVHVPIIVNGKSTDMISVRHIDIGEEKSLGLLLVKGYTSKEPMTRYQLE